MVETAIEMEGTCTGEHGVGMVKKEYLVAELGLETVETMRRIKVNPSLKLAQIGTHASSLLTPSNFLTRKR